MLKDTVKAAKRLDFFLICIVVFLIIFGIVILTSASISFMSSEETTYYLLRHQLLFALLPGFILALIIAAKVPIQYLKKKTHFLLLISLILMLLVFFPLLGKKSGTASRWILIKGMSFQPSELLKLSFILYLASWLESKTKKISATKSEKKWQQNLITFLAIIGIIAVLLFLQSDLSTLAVILITGTIMYFFAETPLLHMVLIGVIGLVCLFLIIRFTPYRLERFLVFLNPGDDPLGKSYQINQALIAIGSGKIFGLGLGMSQQKSGILPHPISDSIFAILAEETGFLGSFLLTLLFLLFLWRGYRIGKESKDMFSKLTALGISSWIIIQAFVNIGSMIGLLPLTGIPLPFISYGGSALMIEMAAVGILLNISRNN